MTTRHPDLEFVAGDDWEIATTLLDENGNPYDLTQPNTVKWILLNASQLVAIASDKVTISYTAPTTGKCSVLVPSTVTTLVPGGAYTDYLRLIMSGQTGTLLIGPILVIGDPWTAPVAMTTFAEGNERPIKLISSSERWASGGKRY
jgi:hypothetical protein